MEDHDARSAAGRTGTDSATGAGEVDEEGRESFPASDPPAAGPAPTTSPAAPTGARTPMVRTSVVRPCPKRTARRRPLRGSAPAPCRARRPPV